ncbi:38215_t:CDS:2 [Gigaspora margarita]|uniref:38215_t:CDS:1 n=1 Tax=Gigaspora margarita TaxID=4874 RepID=A0ABN7UVA6_GIGMA|nr:38215_t:CDS:2 [Gigaspora margarita]
MINASQLKICNTDTIVFNNFEYVSKDYKKDTEGTSLVVKSESVMTEKADEREDINILRENNTDTDVDSSDIVSSSVFDLESGLNEYLIKDIINTSNELNQQLSACPILDTINEESDNNTNNRRTEYRSRYVCSEYFIKQGGHFFEQQGRGNPKFECKHLHKNVMNNGLRILDHWILRMAKTADEATANSPSPMFIKMALRLEHVNLTNIVDQKFDITPETASDLGKALEQQKKEELVENISLQNNQVGNNTISTRQSHEQTGTKRQRRVMNNDEKKLLENLLNYDTFPKDKAVEILRQLQEQIVENKELKDEKKSVGNHDSAE